jgi:periplasmic mercuric ion binding protein
MQTLNTLKIALSALLGLLMQPTLAADISIKADVKGMVCAFCAQGIEARLKKNQASKEIYVNLKNRVVAVELKEGKTYSLESFKADIEESGYTVAKVEYVSDPVSAIRLQYKK